jgi:hypothetical protein
MRSVSSFCAMIQLETPPDEGPDPADGGKALPWGTPATLTPDANLLRWVGRNAAEPAYDVVLLGPSGAGKTSFLTSIGRAAAGEPDIRVVPGISLAGLIGGVAVEVGAQPPATLEPFAVDFQMEIAQENGAHKPAITEAEIEVSALDTPGRALFGGRGLHRGSLVDRCLGAARHATCLVLCVDGERPEPDTWRSTVLELVSQLATDSGVLMPRLASREREPWQDVPPELLPKRLLRPLRLLVLVTKIDVVCERAVRQFGPGLGLSPFVVTLDGLEGRSTASPFDVARQLDPLGTTEALVGADSLGQLRNALSPGAQLAVGLTSSHGIARGQAQAKRPWGVREALLFLACGRLEHPVERVPAATDEPMGPWIEVSPCTREEVP